MRDLATDLEICNAATPGPWETKHEFNVRHAGTHRGICSIGYQDTTDKTIYDTNITNAKFIAASREGWPHAINRAIKAEAEVERLRLMVKSITGGLDEAIETIHFLEAENARLRAVLFEPSIETLASKVHDGWWEEKKLQGFHAPLECPYRTPTNLYGKFEAVCDQCHTDMYPYNELPENIKDYDRVTVKTVLQAIAELDEEDTK